MKDSIIIDSCLTRTDILNLADTLANKLSSAIEVTTKKDNLWGLFTYDTVFTVIVTLFVFISGILLDKLVKHLDKRKKQKELRHYFKHFLDKLKDKICPKLIKMYSHVYQTYGINEGIPSAPPKILTSDFIRIRNIQDKDLFHAFKDKESLSTILSNLDFIELMINEIDNFHKRIRKESDDLRKPLQDKFNKYFETLANYVEHVTKNNPQYPSRDAFRDLVNNSITMFHQQKDFKQQLTKVYKTIIRPIQEQVVQTNIFRSDPIGFEIAELGRDISIQYNYLKRMTIEFRLDYRKFSRQVKEVQDRLIEASQKINWG